MLEHWGHYGGHRKKFLEILGNNKKEKIPKSLDFTGF